MKRLFIALMVCLTAGTAFAGHVDTYGIGSRATSMAGAMTAGTNDAFSVYYNPAAMTKIKKRTFTVGVHLVDPSLEIEKFSADMHSPLTPMAPVESSGSVSDSSPLLKVPHLGYVHPIGDRLALGFAVYVPYGLELEWSSNVAKNAGAYNSYHSWYLREVITPSIAYKVTDKLSVGAGISIGKSKAGVERIRYVPDFMMSSAAWDAALTSVYGGTLDAATISGMANQQAALYADLQGKTYKTEMEDDLNYSFNIGILYEMNEKLAFGFTFRSKADSDLEGDTDVKPDAELWPGQNVDASVNLDAPNQIQLGVEYKPTPKWSVNFDITRTWWGDIEDYTVKFSEPFMGTADEEHYERDWKDTFQYRIGTEYKLNDTVDLRAGYYYDPTVVPNSTFDIQWPDSDKHVFSGGVGLHFGAFTVDFALQYITIGDININGDSQNLNETFTREDDTFGEIHSGEVTADASGHLLAYGVTLSYEF